MARILITWELGDSRGHTAFLNPLGRRLHAAGHEVSFCYRSLNAALAPWGGADVFQAPAYHPLPENEHLKGGSFANTLYGMGLAKPAFTRALLKTWRDLYDLVRPDAVVFEYAPGALLAAAGLPLWKIQVGWGFVVPPAEDPLPLFRYAHPDALAGSLEAERRVGDALASARRSLPVPPLPGLGPAWREVDQTFLFTTPELDHYDRAGTPGYVGKPAPEISGFPPPRWPRMPGPRVFAYLKRSPALRPVMRALARTQCACVVFAAGDAAGDAAPFDGGNIRVTDRPVDMERVLEKADLVITHGGINLVQESLAAGVPLYLLPQHWEQEANARNVARLGAGRYRLERAVTSDAALAEDLADLLENPAWRRRARDFAEDYRSHFPGNAFDTVAGQIDARLAR